MTKHSGSRPKQHERALANPRVRELLEKLNSEWGELDLVERGDRLKELKDLGCTERGLAKALNVDARAVSRDLHISELPPDQRAQIAQGASAARFLHHQQTPQEGTEADRGRREKATDLRSSSAPKSDHELRSETGSDARILPNKIEIEPLIQSVEQLEKRISTLESKVGNVPPQVQEQASAVAHPANTEGDQTSVLDQIRAYQDQKAKAFENHWEDLRENCWLRLRALR